MKAPRSLGARIALTVLPVIALVYARAHLLVPGLGDDAVVRKLQEESPFKAAANVRVFALGVMAFVQAYFLVELVAIAVPRWRRLRHGNPEGRAKLERAARALGLLLGAFQAFGVAQSLAALSSSGGVSDVLGPQVGSISVPVVTATLIGGACIALLVADLVTRQGIVNGLLLLPVIDLVLVTFDDGRASVARAAGCALIGVGSMKRAARVSDGRPPPKLEVLVVADDDDVVGTIGDADVPADIDIRFESVPAGVDEYGARKTTRKHYASVALRDGEAIDAAIARGDAFITKRIALPRGRRFVWEPTFDYDPDTGKETLSGVRSFVVEGDSVITNRDVVDAMASVSTTNAAPDVYIAIELTPDGGERFRELTAKCVNRRIAILLDGRVNSAPVVRQEITGGRMSLTMGAGDYEQKLKEAQALARSLSQK